MNIEREVQQAIKSAIQDLQIIVRFDEDNDLEVSLEHEGEEISKEYIDLSKVFLTKEPQTT